MQPQNTFSTNQPIWMHDMKYSMFIVQLAPWGCVNFWTGMNCNKWLNRLWSWGKKREEEEREIFGDLLITIHIEHLNLTRVSNVNEEWIRTQQQKNIHRSCPIITASMEKSNLVLLNGAELQMTPFKLDSSHETRSTWFDQFSDTFGLLSSKVPI